MNFDRLTHFLDSLVQRGIPAVDLMICKDGASVYRHFTGTRDPQTGIALDGSELYQTCSLSKPVTAVAAMTLVEQGRRCLDDPVSAYLPDKGIALSCNMQVRGAPLKHLHPQLRDLCYECLSL